VGSPDGAVLWRVELDSSAGAPSRPTRVRVLGSDGKTVQALPSQGLRVDTTIPAGPAGRAVVLAERADPGWHARLDGRELVPARHSGWAQAFLLPTAGGHLVVEHRVRGQHLVELARWAMLALGLLAAVPIPSRRRRVLRAARTVRTGLPPSAAAAPAAQRVGKPAGRPTTRVQAPRVVGPGRVPRRRPPAENAPEPGFDLPEIPAGAPLAEIPSGPPPVAGYSVAAGPAEGAEP